MHAHIAPSAIDPIPLDHVTLPEVVTLLTAQMSNRDIATAPPPTVLQTLLGPLDGSPTMGSGPNAESFAAWCKREEAVRVIRLAVLNGGLTAKIAAASGFVRLEKADWQYVAFYDQIIRSGVIRSSVGERIGRHEGSRLLIDKAEVLELLRKRQQWKPAPAAKKCADWLEAEMRASPEHKPRPKPTYCREAVENFGVSVRQFSTIWKSAIAKTGANWNRQGRPSKPEAGIDQAEGGAP